MIYIYIHDICVCSIYRRALKGAANQLPDIKYYPLSLVLFFAQRKNSNKNRLSNKNNYPTTSIVIL